MRGLDRAFESKDGWFAVAGSIAVASFLLDAVSPWGVAVPLLYMIVVKLVTLTEKERWVWIAASASTLLVGIGAALSPHEDGHTLGIDLANRGLALGGVWALAIAGNYRNRKLIASEKRSSTLSHDLQVSHRQVSDRSLALMSMMEDLRHEQDLLKQEAEKRAQTAKALAASEERFRRAVEAAPIALILARQDGQIVMANRTAEEAFGHSKASLEKKQFGHLFDRKREKKGGTLQGHVVAIRADQSTFPAEISFSPMQFAEETCHLYVINDVSEHQELIRLQADMNAGLERQVDIRSRELLAKEALLKKRAEDLERSNEELNRFAYAAAHDLKSPLRAIQNLAEWIAEDSMEQLSMDSREDLRMLQKRAGRMEGLLNSLLAYARIGQKEGQATKIESRNLAEEMAELQARPDAFHIEIAEDLPIIQAPRAALARIFGNLISNAIAHHDQENGVLRISYQQVGDFHEFIFADDGPGIPEEFHERVFQMFQTLKPRDSVEGNGMGLSLVLKTVAIHGGSVRIDPKEDGERGTTFRIQWPISEVAKNEVAA